MKKAIPIKQFTFIFLGLLLVSHFPFLTSDPDVRADINTRGAWTDEGLYASQARNFLISGKLDIKENSTYIRGPLFTWLQIPLLFVTGKNNVVLRLFVLMSFFLSLFVLAKHRDSMVYVFLFTWFASTLYPLFHFSHYALAEMLCIAMIFLAIERIFRWEKQHENRFIFQAVSCIFLAYSLKIQFLYLAAVIPVSLFAASWFRKDIRKPLLRASLYSLIYTMVFLLLYFIFWYLPNRDFYQFVMLRESAGRFPLHFSEFPGAVKFSIQQYIWNPVIAPFLIISSIAILAGLGFSFRKSFSVPVLLVFIWFWLLAEFHKLPMTYLPVRYQLSLFAALGLGAAFSLKMITINWIKNVLVVGMVCTGLFQLFSLYQSFQNRTYDLKRANEYLQRCNVDNKIIAGAWASSVTWKTDAMTYPVWKGFLNDDILQKKRVTAVITEFDEAESDKAFESNGISLQLAADSMKTIRIWRYTLHLYWLAAPKNEKQ